MYTLPMKIAILQREFAELEATPTLFDASNFRARKEARDFAALLRKFDPKENAALRDLKEKAEKLDQILAAFDAEIAAEFSCRLANEKPSPDEFRTWLNEHTSYEAGVWGKPHYGYENLDFLLDEVLLPEPQPSPSLPPEEGMVRYEAMPASVILELSERVDFAEKGAFYDLGSGLGKVTALVHLLSGAPCVGVEYQPDFCGYATEQAQRLELSGIRYLNADARQADYASARVFFFFNPFGGEIFPVVLERLRLEAKKEEILIASYGSSSLPLSEYAWLEQVPPVSDNELALALFRSTR